MQTQVTIAWESKKGDIIGLAASKGQDSLVSLHISQNRAGRVESLLLGLGCSVPLSILGTHGLLVGLDDQVSMKEAKSEGPLCTLVVRRVLWSREPSRSTELRCVSGMRIVVRVAGCTRHAQVLVSLPFNSPLLAQCELGGSPSSTPSSLWLCLGDR